MPIHNNEIADIFDKLADLLEVEDANPFRVRAYRNAAQTVRGYAKRMSDLLQQDEDLSKTSNIGKDLAGKIKTIVETGKLPLLEKVRSSTPAALSDLMKIQGLGPKRVKTLHKKLKIQSLDDLKSAARSGKIRELEGLGKKTEQMIKQRLEDFTGEEARTKLMVAEDIATPLIEYLKKSKDVKEIVVAGSYRRRKETVGDLDILITAKKDSNVMQRFVKYDEVEEVVSKGKTRSTVLLRCGLSVDLRVVPPVSYGAALHYFTGSKAHNIAVRKMAVKKKLKINEYGVFKGDKRIAGKTEAEVYDKVGLPFISPELRENRGEIEASKKDQLPELITLEDIRGDLHCHTKARDGHDGLKQ
ncbi:MAG: helix-hairpin-helix domain-containing protein, partial [Thermodesulfobacteriota bacterium]|nr:helix-hairpin-helix domain-containing protein [Thermodesulfobacteriota bacterium]